jgi:hypothetical protein
VSGQTKTVYGGQWVRVANMRNKRFHADGPCSICQRLTCGTVWYSIETEEVRCEGCFTPVGYVPSARRLW